MKEGKENVCLTEEKNVLLMILIYEMFVFVALIRGVYIKTVFVEEEEKPLSHDLRHRFSDPALNVLT